MHFEDIRSLTRATPFEPFRILLTTGEMFDMRHPDMILATSGAAHISVLAPGGPPDSADRVKIVSLLHIQKFAFLQAASSHSKGSNGPAANA